MFCHLSLNVLSFIFECFVIYLLMFCHLSLSAVVAAEEPKKVISQVEPVTVDSDAELGNLVIDEGEKKKPMKRKSMASVNTPVR